jgi:hypothetical protein
MYTNLSETARCLTQKCVCKEKLIVLQLLRKLSAFCASRGFIIFFLKNARHFLLAKPVDSVHALISDFFEKDFIKSGKFINQLLQEQTLKKSYA